MVVLAKKSTLIVILNLRPKLNFKMALLRPCPAYSANSLRISVLQSYVRRLIIALIVLYLIVVAMACLVLYVVTKVLLK